MALEVVRQDFDRERIIELFMSRARASFDLQDGE